MWLLKTWGREEGWDAQVTGFLYCGIHQKLDCWSVFLNCPALGGPLPELGCPLVGVDEQAPGTANTKQAQTHVALVPHAPWTWLFIQWSPFAAVLSGSVEGFATAISGFWAVGSPAELVSGHFAKLWWLGVPGEETRALGSRYIWEQQACLP